MVRARHLTALLWGGADPRAALAAGPSCHGCGTRAGPSRTHGAHTMASMPGPPWTSRWTTPPRPWPCGLKPRVPAPRLPTRIPNTLPPDKPRASRGQSASRAAQDGTVEMLRPRPPAGAWRAQSTRTRRRCGSVALLQPQPPDTRCYAPRLQLSTRCLNLPRSRFGTPPAAPASAWS